MKRVLFISILATLLTACTAEFTEEISSLSPQTLSVSFEDDSRISLNEDGKTIWNADDEVSVFYRSYINECWKYTGATGATNGNLVNQGESNDQTTDRIVAVYPYNDNYLLTDSYLSLIIPNRQSYANNSYGLGDNIMIASTQGYNLYFRNIFGFLRLSLSGDKNIESIEIKGNNNEIIAGKATIGLQNLDITFNGNNSKSITIDCQDGVQLTEAPKTFHFALAPQTFTKGITITIFCTGGEKIVKSTSKAINIERNHILPMANLDYTSSLSVLQRNALIELYNATAGQSWKNNKNWCSSLPISSWYGVKCNKDGIVTGIELSDNNLNGTLPQSFAVLMDSCKYLEVGFNSLSGAVPQSVIEHKNWQYLWGDILSSTKLDYNYSDIPFPEFTIKDTEGVEVTSESVWKDKKVVIFYGWDENCLNDLYGTIYNLYHTYSKLGLEVLGWTTEYFYNNYYFEGGYGIFPWKTYPQLATKGNTFRPGCGYYPTAYLPAVTIFGEDRKLIYSTSFSTKFYSSDIENAVEKALTSNGYTSTDFSKDGEAKLLQKATEGNGIDIVLMGDGYSDRLIADGTYDKVMSTAMEAFFSEEPYKSHRNLFNVYSVKAVSHNESFTKGSKTALSSYFGEGTLVGGDDSAAMNYALNAIEYSRLGNSTIIVMLNSPKYAGTCYMYYPDGYSSGNTLNNDHGQGLSVSYFPIGVDDAALQQVLAHESCGHGFAKLADEYSYQEYGRIPSSEVADAKEMQGFGWFRNVDFTDDPEKVLWSHFLADTRYRYDGLGLFLGGYTYWSGVWRPTDNSIMRHNTDGFNAPSRERIYYRIHKLAYGTSWQYNYEDFVAFDAVSRKTSAAKAASEPLIMRPTEHTPPIVRPYSWSEALKR